MTAVVSFSDLKRVCGNCSLRELCLPYGISATDLKQLEQMVQRLSPIARGKLLFRQGDPLRSIFAIRMGSVKSVTVAEDGAEQITGFHFPGELVGFDAIAADVHDCSVVALEDTSVCEIPFDRLDELSGSVPGLRRQLMRLLSREIQQDQQMLLLLGKKGSEARLAAFLLSLSSRFVGRGLSASRFHLSMSRGEIANYLGLAMETISRLLARFQQDGLMMVDGREVTLLDLPRLHVVADMGGEGGGLTRRREG
ncbi:MAG: fumarate/nitrate reduction transcriptional regulator Fnr [Pseudomonadota bacterium]